MAYQRNGYVLNEQENAARLGNSASVAATPRYGMTDSGLYYMNNSADSYVNAFNQEAAWARDDMIRREGYAREDTAYQRMFEDLKKAGINPVLALSSVESLTGATGQSASSFKTSNYDENEKTKAANSAKVVGAILAALAMIAAAAL